MNVGWKNSTCYFFCLHNPSSQIIIVSFRKVFWKATETVEQKSVTWCLPENCNPSWMVFQRAAKIRIGELVSWIFFGWLICSFFSSHASMWESVRMMVTKSVAFPIYRGEFILCNNTFNFTHTIQSEKTTKDIQSAM